MKAKVTAWHWDKDLQEKFGERGSVYDFPKDTETFMKEFVVPFGRVAVLQISGDLLEIEFQNDYD